MVSSEHRSPMQSAFGQDHAVGDAQTELVEVTVKVLYTAEATAWGGREGRSASSDGNLDVQLVLPKELGGPGGPGTNPEQLFAAGYAGCFHSALKLVAARDKLDVSESAITVRVGLGANDSGGFVLEAAIEAELPGLDRDTATMLLEAAHAVCPYSNATRGNIEVTLTLHEEE
jgi:Ohr subfamily peroxiredoxin